MSFTEFETVKEAAVRLGVTPRAIQKWAAEGKIPGAAKHGKSWMIPKNAAVAENTGKENEPPNSVSDVYQMSPFRMAMPLLNSAYPVGRVMEYLPLWHQIVIKLWPQNRTKFHSIRQIGQHHLALTDLLLSPQT